MLIVKKNEMYKLLEKYLKEKIIENRELFVLMVYFPYWIFLTEYISTYLNSHFLSVRHYILKHIPQ